MLHIMIERLQQVFLPIIASLLSTQFVRTYDKNSKALGEFSLDVLKIRFTDRALVLVPGNLAPKEDLFRFSISFSDLQKLAGTL